ncbi:MAG: hypothetical protein ACKOPQ_08450, partial [Novosphingobium sp.]
MADRPPLLNRPGSGFDARQGLLRAEHFQMAWATNDLEQAQGVLRERLGIRHFTPIGGPNPQGGETQVLLAWAGTMMYELITASGPGSDIILGRLPQGEGFAMKHHHLGYLIAGPAEWDALEAETARAGWAMPHKSVNPGFITSCFVDVPVLGHYLEYIMPEPA